MKSTTKNRSRKFLQFSLFLFLFFLSPTKAFTSENSFQQKFQAFAGFFYPSTISGGTKEIQLVYEPQINNCKLLFGFGLDDSRLDFTSSVNYLPDFFDFRNKNKNFTLEFSEQLHFRLLYDISFQFDSLSGINFSYSPVETLNFELKFYYFLKLAKIFSINPVLVTNEIAFAASIQKDFAASFIKFGASSYDIFYYPELIAPIWNFGFGYHFSDKITGLAHLNFRYIDMFTLSAYIECVEFKIGAEFKL